MQPVNVRTVATLVVVPGVTTSEVMIAGLGDDVGQAGVAASTLYVIVSVGDPGGGGKFAEPAEKVPTCAALAGRTIW